MRNRELMLTVASRVENVRWIAAAVGGLCTALPMDDKTRFDVRLCVAEAVTNCVRHAYRYTAHKPIQVIARSKADWLQIAILDEGEAIPAERVRTTDIGPEPIESDGLKEGGRGLFLIYELMDDASYHTDGTTNVLLLSKRLWSSQLREQLQVDPTPPPWPRLTDASLMPPSAE